MRIDILSLFPEMFAPVKESILGRALDNNLIELEISDEEMKKRLADFKPQIHSDIKRGFVRNFIDNVTQADEGCDLTYMQYKD